MFALFGTEAVRQETQVKAQIKAQIVIPVLHFGDTTKPQNPSRIRYRPQREVQYVTLHYFTTNFPFLFEHSVEEQQAVVDLPECLAHLQPLCAPVYLNWQRQSVLQLEIRP